MKERGKDEGVGQNKGEDEESLLGRIKKNKKGGYNWEQSNSSSWGGGGQSKRGSLTWKREEEEHRGARRGANYLALIWR